MTLRLSRLLAIAVLAAVLATAVACESLGPTGAVTGKVRFASEVALPEGAVVTIKLLDTTLADAPSMELGRDMIENADRLPVSPNPPKDTDGRREDSGRGWVRELQGRWPGVLG